jgi:hypothetical protein
MQTAGLAVAVAADAKQTVHPVARWRSHPGGRDILSLSTSTSPFQLSRQTLYLSTSHGSLDTIFADGLRPEPANWSLSRMTTGRQKKLGGTSTADRGVACRDGRMRFGGHVFVRSDNGLAHRACPTIHLGFERR